MNLHEQFVGASDTSTHRVCGICGKLKPFKEFYKDGQDKNGNARYRRDCKACYKKTRIATADMKKPKQWR